MARQVGNAVPVLIAEAFGKHFISHCETYQAIGVD
jgi:site-specific DNA-cytosine methylase